MTISPDYNRGRYDLTKILIVARNWDAAEDHIENLLSKDDAHGKEGGKYAGRYHPVCLLLSVYFRDKVGNQEGDRIGQDSHRNFKQRGPEDGDFTKGPPVKELLEDQVGNHQGGYKQSRQVEVDAVSRLLIGRAHAYLILRVKGSRA